MPRAIVRTVYVFSSPSRPRARRTDRRPAGEPDYRAGWVQYGMNVADEGQPDEALVARVIDWARETGRVVHPLGLVVRRQDGRIHIACAAR
jgi:hypothetical protein